MDAPAARFQYGPMRVPGDAGLPGVPSRPMLSYDSPGRSRSPMAVGSPPLPLLVALSVSLSLCLSLSAFLSLPVVISLSRAHALPPPFPTSSRKRWTKRSQVPVQQSKKCRLQPERTVVLYCNAEGVMHDAVGKQVGEGTAQQG